MRLLAQFRSKEPHFQRNWLILAIFLTIIALSAACLRKYGLFAYNGIDLAYFNQVFWNTVHGRPFQQSIHPHLSLGDHAEFAILPLSLLYALWQDPRWLLIMQATALAAAAWPVWRIARLRSPERAGAHALLPLLMAIAWLLNPLVQNIALFEFHVLPFALLPLLMALLAYEEGRKLPFIAWIGAALLVREDVALVVVMIAALAWMERKSLWWRVVPAVVGAGWFFAAMQLIARFSTDGGYKYRVYYEWLGETPLRMIAGAAGDPLRLLQHVVTLPNFEMLLGMLMPLAFLPLLRPSRLVLALGPLAQILLGAPGGGEIVLQTHYATLFLPALTLAAIDGMRAAPDAFRRIARGTAPQDAARAVAAVLVISAGYSSALMGPLPSAVAAGFDASARQRAVAAEKILAGIPADGSVAASYALLPALSSRERLWSLHYAFLGVTQFGTSPYALPDDVRFFAVDVEDLSAYRAQFLRTAWAAPHYAGGNERLYDLVGDWSSYVSPFALFDRQAASYGILIPPETGDGRVGTPASEYAFTVDARVVRHPRDGRLLLASARWMMSEETAKDLTVRVDVRYDDGTVLSRRQPVIAVPPFSYANVEGYLTTVQVPHDEAGPRPLTATFVLEREKVDYVLNGMRSAELRVQSAETLDVLVTDVKR